MHDGEFHAWLPTLRDEYAQDLVRDYGMPADAAYGRIVELCGWPR